MTPVSKAAKAHADQLVAREWGYCAPGTVAVDALYNAFARFVQEVSDAAKEATWQAEGVAVRMEVLAPFILPEPVDELLIEAERMSCGDHVWSSDCDFDASTKLALAALRRGIELGREQGK